MIDYTLRYVKDLGFMPILVIDGEEVYRGEYQGTIEQALEKCELAHERILLRG